MKTEDYMVLADTLDAIADLAMDTYGREFKTMRDAAKALRESVSTVHTLMQDVQTALRVLAGRTEECESLRAQLSEAQARLEKKSDLLSRTQSYAVIVSLKYAEAVDVLRAVMDSTPIRNAQGGLYKGIGTKHPDGIAIKAAEDFLAKIDAAPVSPAAQAVDVADICNAYESGVGHNGRPTANVNPYPAGSLEHEAYRIGATGTKHNGKAAQVAQSAQPVSDAYKSEAQAVADESRFSPPFDNCKFELCDLPGQCRNESKCHHPQRGLSSAQPVADDVVPKALAALSSAMQSDPDFAWTWHCNIAMTAQDAGAPHDRSNVWAANFMQRAFGVDTLTRVNALLAAQQQQEGEP